MGKIRNQGESQFCYAFTAADLLSEAIGISPEKQISAFDLGARYINMSDTQMKAAKNQINHVVVKPQENWRYEFGSSFSGIPLSDRVGGFTATAVAQTLQKPICLESEVPSEDSSNEYQDAKVFINDLMLRSLKPPASKNNQSSCQNCQYDTSRQLENFRNMIEAINDYTAQRILQQSSRLCRNPIQIPGKIKIHRKTYVRRHVTTQGTTLLDHDLLIRDDISKLLASGRPVAIDFDSCVTQTCPEGQRAVHAATVVGQRSNGEKCEFLVRDSYGPGCNKKLRTDLKCEEGHYWISSEQLTSSTISINWVQPD